MIDTKKTTGALLLSGIVAFLMHLSGSTIAQNQPARDLLKKGEKQIQQNNEMRALNLARRLRSANSPEYRLVGHILLARVLYRRSNDDELKEQTREILEKKAQHEFQKLLATRQKGENELDLSIPVRAAIARLHRDIGGQPTKALSILNKLGKDATGTQRALIGEDISDTFRSMGGSVQNLKKAREWINFSIRVVNESKSGVSSYARVQYDDLMNRLKSKRVAIDRILTVIRHGLGYYLFREARRKQVDGQYKQAIDAFDELIKRAEENEGNENALDQLLNADHRITLALLKNKLEVSPIYVVASEYRRLECLVRLKQYQKALAGARTFQSDHFRYKIYSGAVKKLVADVFLFHKYAPDKALPRYTEALKWHRSVKKHDRTVDSISVPDKAKKVTKPPEDMKEVVGWGNISWTQPDPDDLVNRVTWPKYIDYQRMKLATSRSLCYFTKSLLQTGKQAKTYRQKALTDIKVINEVDQLDRERTESGMWSNYTRLRDGYGQGHLFARRSLKLFVNEGKKMLVGFLTGELLYEMEEWKKARRAYRRFIDRFGDGKLSNFTKGQRAYLTLVLVNTGVMSGVLDADEARKKLEQFRGRYKFTPVGPRALIMLAEYYQDGERFEVFKEVYNRFPDHPMGKQALLRLGQNYHILEQYEKATKYLKLLMKVGEEKWRVEGARNLLESVREDWKEKKKKQTEQKEKSDSD